MAIYKPAPAFDNISGALTKINKKSPHAADQKMVLAQHRVAPTKTKNGCNRLYLRGLESVTRSTPVSASEQAQRSQFAQISQQVTARMKTTSETYATDYAAFKAQKDLPNGEPTCRSYLWKVVKESL